MSDEEEDIDEEGEEESGGGKKKLFLIIGVVVLLLGGGGAGAYFMGVFGDGEEHVEEVVVIPPGPPVYHEFPQLVVDLKKKGKRTNYIKLKVVVEIVTRDLPLLQARELKIVDKMQTYLRSQTRDDVAGGAGTELMRTGITKIVTDIMGEVKTEGVLFREILLQ
jgi:flagellar protein FliL